MPPHCDALDGPVVKAAMRALEADGEDEIRAAFSKTLTASPSTADRAGS